MAPGYAFADSLGGLQSQIAQQRGQASSNFFNTLAANRTALAQAQQQRQQELNNAANFAQLISNARSARARHALADRENAQGMALAIMREGGLNRRAREAQESNLELQRGAQNLARQYREEDLEAAREDRNLKLGLDVIRRDAVDPGSIGIPATPEMRKLWSSQFAGFQRQEEEANKMAEQTAQALNTQLSNTRLAAQELMDLGGASKVAPVDVRLKVADIIKRYNVPMETIPMSQTQLPTVATKLLSDAVAYGQSQGRNLVNYNPQTLRFEPIVSTRYQRAAPDGGGGAPAAPDLEGMPEFDPEEDPDSIGTRMTTLLRSRGLSREDAALRAAWLMRSPEFRDWMAGQRSTNAVPYGTD